MCALAAWTFAVLLDFRFGESPRIYVVCLALYATLSVDAAAVILAALWLRFAVALLAR
jgi:hypothetical protein